MVHMVMVTTSNINTDQHHIILGGCRFGGKKFKIESALLDLAGRNSK
jgi:hypothetical protein